MSNILSLLEKNKKLSTDYNFSERLAAELHTFYINNDNVIEKRIISIIGGSKIDSNITLMPMQLYVLNKIDKNNNIVISAPTSFGKSFIVLEYIKRNKQKYSKIFYIVHTKSLKDEISDKMKKIFSPQEYEILEEIDEIEETQRFICVLVSDGQNIYEYNHEIDLFIVDEAYNLDKEHSGTRYFCIINSYRLLLEKAKKTILIGPFISELQGEEANKYELIKSDYSPVVSELYEGDKLQYKSPSEAFLQKIKDGENTISYFSSKQKIYNYMYEIEKLDLPDRHNDDFIKWMENSFPDFWLLPQIMKKGIGLYHSAFPKYINKYNMKKFNSGVFKGLITTSAILEGVNTSSKNLIIFETNIGGNDQKLTPFQFFNLCGRVGRLGKEIVGNVYNFGELYGDRYKEKSLPLFIGIKNINDIDEKVDENIDDDETQKQIVRIKIMLEKVGIDYDKWYAANKFFFNGSRNLFIILKEYFLYRKKLKDGLMNKELLNADGKLGKNKILNHVYSNFIYYIKDFYYRPSSRFYVNNALEVLLTSENKGIDFSMKKICIDYRIKKNLDELDIPQKNQYIVEIMNVGYNYIPNNYYKISYILNEFIKNDNYFTENIKRDFEAKYFNRILFYLNGDVSKYSRVNKILNSLGFLPTLIDKIIDYLENNNTNVENKSRKEIVNIVTGVIKNIKLEEYESINLIDIGF